MNSDSRFQDNQENSSQNTEFKIERLNSFLELQNAEILSSDNLFELISALIDPTENELVQAAVLPVLIKFGKDAAPLLFDQWSELQDCQSELPLLSSSDFAAVSSRLSYALSQISETPTSVFDSFLLSDIPRVRQNAVIGFSKKTKNDRSFDNLLFHVLKTDADPETAFEAATALSLGKTAVLSFFEEALSDNFSKKADHHVFGKVIEISGEIGECTTLPLLESYLSDSDARLSNAAVEAIQKIKFNHKI